MLVVGRLDLVGGQLVWGGADGEGRGDRGASGLALLLVLLDGDGAVRKRSAALVAMQPALSAGLYKISVAPRTTGFKCSIEPRTVWENVSAFAARLVVLEFAMILTAVWPKDRAHSMLNMLTYQFRQDGDIMETNR